MVRCTALGGGSRLFGFYAPLLCHRPVAARAALGVRTHLPLAALTLRWLALVALVQGAMSPPAPYWLEGVSCPFRGGYSAEAKPLFDGGGLYQSRDDAKRACAFSCLATSGCAYADLYFVVQVGALSVERWATCYLVTDFCGEHRLEHRGHSLFVVPALVPPPPSTPSPATCTCDSTWCSDGADTHMPSPLPTCTCCSDGADGGDGGDGGDGDGAACACAAPPSSTPSSAPSSTLWPTENIIFVVALAGLIAAVCVCIHCGLPRPGRPASATRATHASPTHGADDRADQGDGGGVGGVPSPYLQMPPTAEVLPVGLPVAASEEMVTVDGSWAPAYPASGGSWAPASGGGAAAESGAGLVVVTGLVLPNV